MENLSDGSFCVFSVCKLGENYGFVESGIEIEFLDSSKSSKIGKLKLKPPFLVLASFLIFFYIQYVNMAFYSRGKKLFMQEILPEMCKQIKLPSLFLLISRN